MPTATLTSKGQTVIPKAIRDHLGLHPGDALDFVVQDNGDVLIRPATEDIRRLKGLLHRPGRLSVSVREMDQAIRNSSAHSSFVSLSGYWKRPTTFRRRIF